MAKITTGERLLVLVGILGVIALLAGVMRYAFLESGTHYETTQIRNLVQEKITVEANPKQDRRP